MIDLKPACHRMIDVLTGVADDQLTSASPCTDYTVGDLIDLVSRGATALAHHSAELPGTDGAHLDPGWRDSVTRHVGELGEAWDDPAAWRGGASVPGSDLWGKITLTELVVHGWDIATATGQPFDLPEHTLHACLEHVTAFVPNAPVPGLWEPSVPVAADAVLLDRILAITGRAP